MSRQEGTAQLAMSDAASAGRAEAFGARAATLEVAQPSGWQAAAVEEYERSWTLRQADLRDDLSTRISALAGRRIPPRRIYTDGHFAACDLDGATFRLYHGGVLVLVRRCAYCGTGRFESPKISGPPDLGYALAAWRPLHEDCEQYTPEEVPDL